MGYFRGWSQKLSALLNFAVDAVCLHVSILLATILDRIKKEITPPPKINVEFTRKAICAIFVLLNGGRGGLNFSFDLSKIVDQFLTG